MHEQPTPTREYRVTWQRDGLPKRRKLYQRRDAAERWIRRLGQEGYADVDPDDFACCSGFDQGVQVCGCNGLTNAEAWEQTYAKMPRLVGPPVFESRVVGEWETHG